MVEVCAWCQSVTGLARTSQDHTFISHGICTECAANARKGIRDFERDKACAA